MCPRLGYTWTEKSFAFFSVLLHAGALWVNLRGGMPFDIPKWFDLTFGIPSPTSGTGRAFLAVNRGDLIEALMFNPVGALAAIYALLFPLYLAVSAYIGKAIAVSRRAGRACLYASLFALVASWMVKLLWLPRELW